jgi:hypothetical protein
MYNIINNIVVFRSDEVATTVNVGSATAPETFKFAHNFWYCLDNSGNSKPDIPVSESEGFFQNQKAFMVSTQCSKMQKRVIFVYNQKVLQKAWVLMG